jgi:hypothetical protein
MRVPGRDAAAGLLARFTRNVQKPLSVLVIAKGRLTLVATRRDMVNRAR